MTIYGLSPSPTTLEQDRQLSHDHTKTFADIFELGLLTKAKMCASTNMVTAHWVEPGAVYDAASMAEVRPCKGPEKVMLWCVLPKLVLTELNGTGSRVYCRANV